MDQNASAATDLDHARQDFSVALARRDARSAADSYTDDARLLPPLVDLIEGREQIRAFWQAGIDSGICGLELVPIGCTEVEGIAYELGRYAISMDSEAALVAERGRYITVHRLINGRWQRAAEMFMSDSRS